MRLSINRTPTKVLSFPLPLLFLFLLLLSLLLLVLLLRLRRVLIRPLRLPHLLMFFLLLWLRRTRPRSRRHAPQIPIPKVVLLVHL